MIFAAPIGRAAFVAASAIVMATVPCASPAQGIVAGVVLDRADGSPVASAEIRVTRSGARARTSEAGRFTVAAAADDTLAIRALGFRGARVSAQVSGGDLRVLLDRVPTVLPAMVTTVGQRAIRAAETPASVSIISSQELDAAAAVSANQLLRQLPGLLELPAQPSRSTIAIRGLDAARVLILIDGEPAAGTLIDSRDVGRLSTLGTERIEVVKGPSSVEFGSDALGGVINLVTAAPTQNLSVDATARGGELGRKESSLQVSNTVGPVGFRLDGGWRQSDRVVGVNAEGPTLERVYDLRGDSRWHASDRLTLRGNTQLSRERQRWPVGGGYNGFIDNLTAQGFAEAQLAALGGAFRARLFGQRFAYQFRQAQGPVPIAGTADSLEQREVLGRVLLAYSRIAGAHSIDAGVQGSHRDMVAPKKVEGDRAGDEVTEIFARDAVQYGSLLLTVGGRSTTSTLWGSTFAPSFGAAWQASPRWRLRTTLARGFRAPSFKEIRYTFLNPSAGYTVQGNPDLRPERSWSSSAAAAWSPHDAVVIEVEGYRNNLTNLIDRRFAGTNAAGLQVYRSVNVSRARTQGLETSARVMSRSAELTLGYDYLDARDLESRARLDGRSTHSARAALGRSWPVLRGLQTDLSARYTSNAPVGTRERGALLTVDAQLRLKLLSEIEASAGVNNLFDQRAALWSPAFERQLFAGVRIRWADDGGSAR